MKLIALPASCIRTGVFVATFVLAGGGMSAATEGAGAAVKLRGESWIMFVPAESRTADCGVIEGVSDTPSHQPGVTLHSHALARFAIREAGAARPVRPGERYRVSVWVRPHADWRSDASTPGIVLRATLFAAPGIDAIGGHVFIGVGASSRGAPTSAMHAPKRDEWTQVTGVLEIPPHTRFVQLFVFGWRSIGNFDVDRPVIERVDGSTAVTPLTTVGPSR